MIQPRQIPSTLLLPESPTPAPRPAHTPASQRLTRPREQDGPGALQLSPSSNATSPVTAAAGCHTPSRPFWSRARRGRPGDAGCRATVQRKPGEAVRRLPGTLTSPPQPAFAAPSPGAPWRFIQINPAGKGWGEGAEQAL